MENRVRQDNGQPVGRVQSGDRLPVVSARSIQKSFGALEVLKGISLDAFPHDVISILGASGSGKSTFLRCLNLLERPNHGEITVCGEQLLLKRGSDGTLAASDLKQLRRIRCRLAMVFQQFNLWTHMSALENVMAAPIHVRGLTRSEARDLSETMLARVGLEAKRDEFPAFLSGGQQQRVAIARALAMEPDAILFDEPTSSLDPELVGEVLRVIRGLADEGRTMLVVTHEMDFARHVSSQVAFFHQGEIEEQGPPEDLFERPRSERLASFLRRIRR